MEKYLICLIEVADTSHFSPLKVLSCVCFILKWSSIKINVVLRILLSPLNYLVPELLFCFVLFYFCFKGRRSWE